LLFRLDRDKKKRRGREKSITPQLLSARNAGAIVRSGGGGREGGEKEREARASSYLYLFHLLLFLTSPRIPFGQEGERGGEEGGKKKEGP